MTHNPFFNYVDNTLHCESVSLTALAQRHGTPLYVYSANAVRANYRRLAAAFAPLHPLICYAMKANFNLTLLKLLKAEGAGFDIVSGGELARALAVGADPAHIVFAGVGKTDAELTAALDARVGWINLESTDETARLNALAAARGQTVDVAVRLNPGVEAHTHQHIQTGGERNKFGLPLGEALALVQETARLSALRWRGVHIHIGSQLEDAAPTLQALEVALQFCAAVPSIDTLDIGGGFPVAYRETDAYPSIEDFAAPIVQRLLPLADRLQFHLEPGRYLVANAGVLLTTVQAVKNVAGRRTLVVDAGMHTLLRPALYEAYHPTLPLTQALNTEPHITDIVGPICESADVLARDRTLPPLVAGDVLALTHAGAYGFSMASNYNSQPRPAEVLVDGEAAQVIRRREAVADLWALEQ